VALRPQFTIVDQCNILTWSAGKAPEQLKGNKKEQPSSKTKLRQFVLAANKKAKNNYAIKQVNHFSTSYIFKED